jgi:hypothetical protein
MIRVQGFVGGMSILLSAAAVVGCAHAQPAIFVKASDASALREAKPGQPIIVEFNEGEAIPLNVSIQGQFLETAPDAPAVTIVAKRHFFLRIHGSEMKASLDSTHFDARPTAKGVFSIGFGFAPAGMNAHISIVTPKYDLPGR